MRRHLILIGLPGSGKTTVGRLVAATLQASFLDVDARLVETTGRSIPVIFQELGEAAFRRMERLEVERSLEGPATVIAPGGGWAAEGANLAHALRIAYGIYLKTDPRVAAQRASVGGVRPVLVGNDPVRRLEELLAQREPFYQTAHAHVVTDRCNPAEVADEVVALARSQAGW